MRKILFALAGTAIIGFSSCSSNSDGNNDHVEPAATRTAMITNANWVMTSSVHTESGRSINVFADQAATAQDDIFRFNTDGVAIRKEGATRITGNPDEVDRGTWSFLNQEQELKVDLPSLPVNDQIVELTKEKLVIRNFNNVQETLTSFEAR
jgi:hypothetical protein